MQQDYIRDAAVVRAVIQAAEPAAGFLELMNSTVRPTWAYALGRIIAAHSGTSQHAAYNELLDVISGQLTYLRKTHSSDALYSEIREAISSGYSQFRQATTIPEMQAAYQLLMQAYVALAQQTLPGYTMEDRALFDQALRHGHHDELELPTPGTSGTRMTECVVFSRQELSAFAADLLKQHSK
jgi:hypothetical protein